MKKLAALLAALALAAPAASRAAVLNDEVTSAKLKEADNTASQDTNSGSGVKTGHIQNKAVTAAKIADGAVGATQLGAAAVTAAKLAPAAVGTAAVADGSITAAKIAPGVLIPPTLADGSVTTAKLADGAVTDAKITGPISAGKLGAHGHAITDVEALESSLADRVRRYEVYTRFANVIVVSKDGRGDYTDPAAALASIAGANASNRYLVKILPGIYEVSATINTFGYVDIEGSGRDVTIITTAPGVSLSGIFNLGPWSEVRDLSILSDSAYCAVGGGSYTLRNVGIDLSGAGVGYGAIVGVMGNAQLPIATTLKEVSIKVTGAPGVNAIGVVGNSGEIKLLDSSVDVTSGGPYAIGMNLQAYATSFDAERLRVVASGAPTVYGIAGAGPLRLRNGFVSVQGDTATAIRTSGADVSESELRATGTTAYATQITVHPVVFKLAYTLTQGALAPSGYPDSRYRCLGLHDTDLNPLTCP